MKKVLKPSAFMADGSLKKESPNSCLSTKAQLSNMRVVSKWHAYLT